jgi:hypothetical protein
MFLFLKSPRAGHEEEMRFIFATAVYDQQPLNACCGINMVAPV